MADDKLTTSDLDTTSDTEPATKHDVGIGGGLGAVGGAIVGALAGGPVGAVIGAIAGGAASAGAVDVVDKHDHDFARTAPDASPADAAVAPAYTAGTMAETAADATTPRAATDYTGPGDYQRTQAPVDTGYAAAAAPTSSAAAPTSSAVGTDTARTIELHEEELRASTQAVQTGEVTLRKEVITETKSIDVPVTREEVVIERHAVAGAAASGSFDTQADEVIRVPVMEEQVTVEKTPIVTEEISLGKREVTETQHITDTVRREEAYIENPNNVDVLERGGAASSDRS